MRALAYHAAITTALAGQYDDGGFTLTERADALYELFRAYCDGETVSDESTAGTGVLPSWPFGRPI